MVWAALTFITHLPKSSSAGGEIPVVVRVVRVSGTIKKAEEEVIRRARHVVERARRWESGPMVESVQRAADAERRREREVLVGVDGSGGEEEDVSE